MHEKCLFWKHDAGDMARLPVSGPGMPATDRGGFGRSKRRPGRYSAGKRGLDHATNPEPELPETARGRRTLVSGAKGNAVKKSTVLPILIALSVVGLPALAAPPPPPPPLTAPTPSASPSASPSAAAPSPAPTDTPLINPFGPPAKSSPKPAVSATPTPPPDNRTGIEGVWEVQIQRGDKTEYTHFALKQTQTALTGLYLDARGKKFPLSGSIDDQTVRVVVSLPDGTTQLFTGKLTGTTDMLGMLATAKENIPFTAAYRPKEKWIDNINAQPGGLGGNTGGGIPPR